MALESITILDLDIIIFHNRIYSSVGQNSLNFRLQTLKFEENEEKKLSYSEAMKGRQKMSQLLSNHVINHHPKKSSSQPSDLKIIFGFAAGRELVEL